MQTSVKTVVEGLEMADELRFEIRRECHCSIKITDGEKEEVFENVMLVALAPGMVSFMKKVYSEYQVIISPTMRVDIYSDYQILDT